MPKIFYTEHEIEDLFKSGVTRIDINDNVVLTGLAYEKAVRLGMQLVQPSEQVSDAPVRPYLSKVMVNQNTFRDSRPSGQPLSQYQTTGIGTENQKTGTLPADIQSRIKNAVIAKLGSNVDQGLLDIIIRRVLDQVKV